MLGVLHQLFTYAAPPRLSVDNQRRDPHDGRGVLQHPADVQCDKAQRLPISDSEEHRIRAGQGELPDMLRCLPCRDIVPQFPQKEC